MLDYPKYEKYKESGIEWLGEIPEGWEVKPLWTVAQINPSKSEVSSVSNDFEVSFLPMEAVTENGDFHLKETRHKGDVYDGFTYFCDNDVIIAKITPCFENGKAALTNGLVNGIGFGSTEFHVLRQTNINNKFLFYIIHQEEFRKVGEIEMKGAAGQKRVPQDFLKQYPIAYPPISNQKEIAEFLDRKTAEIDNLIKKQEELLTLLDEKRSAMITHAVTKGLNPNAPLKETNIPWLGKIPEGWEVKKLKFLGEPIIGLTYSPKDITDNVKSIRVLRSTNIQSNTLLLDDGNDIFVELKIPKKMYCQKGDILICARNGSAKLVGKNVLIKANLPNVSFGAFTTIFRSENHEFLYWVLNSNIFFSQLGNFATTTINQLTIDFLKNLAIATPSLEEEQKEIADYLDRECAKIDKSKEKIKALIEKLKEYRTSLITHAVTGKIKVA